MYPSIESSSETSIADLQITVQQAYNSHF